MVIEPSLLPVKTGGRREKHSHRAIVNAILLCREPAAAGVAEDMAKVWSTVQLLPMARAAVK